MRNRFSPASILAVTVGGIFLAEVIAMLVIYNLRSWSFFWQTALDASIMTIIIFPLLYFLLFKPLLREIDQRQQTEQVLHSRLRLIQYANDHSLAKLLQACLDEIETLTGSTFSYFFILNNDLSIAVPAWSTNTRHSYQPADKGDHSPAIQPGSVWRRAVQQRQPVIVNGRGEGVVHVGALQQAQELVVPILRADEIQAVLGMAKSGGDFTSREVELAGKLADFAWDIVNHKQAEMNIQQSEEKFRLLVDWTHDWETWLDPHGKIVYTSHSCERITGFSSQAFIAEPDLLIRIVHPQDQAFYAQHQSIVHDAQAGPDRVVYRILDREGNEHWIEHVCRPLFEPDGHYLGRRISNHDISERIEAERVIREQTEREIILKQTIQNLRNDIARDLHDSLGQNVSFLRMNLEHLSESSQGEIATIKDQLQNMTQVADESYELIRAMLAILRSDNSTDPLSLFTRYADQVSARSLLHVRLTSQGNPQALSPLQLRQLFYIFREGLSNIEKSAAAENVTVEFIWQEQAVQMVITDDGCGFDPGAVPAADHYGLKFMHERAERLNGSLLVQSAPGEGTTITVVAPYEIEQTPVIS